MTPRIGTRRPGRLAVPEASGDANGEASRSRHTGKLATLARDTPVLAGRRPLGAPAATSPLLHPVDTDMERLRSGGQLSVRKEFDAESKKLTAPLFHALEDTRIMARRYFDRQHRLPVYSAFKRERDAKHPAGPDITGNRHYTAIALQRMQDTAILRDEEGDGLSELEKLLPAGSSLRRLLEPATGSIRDIRTGLNADLTSRQGPPPERLPIYRLVFPGTGLVDTSGVQTGASILQFLGIGGVPAAYRDALRLVQEIRNSLPPGATLELGGHSLGGGIATYVGLKLGLKAVGFNSAMLGPACMKDLRQSGSLTPERLARVHQVRIEGDPVTSRKVNQLLVALTSLGQLFPWHAPRLLGQVHQIGTDHEAHPRCNVLERHGPSAFASAYGLNSPARVPASAAPVR